MRGPMLIIDKLPDVAYLDEQLLDDAGRIRVLPAESYNNIDPTHLRVWCHLKARYTLPTVELLQWLREQIGSRHSQTIEIGAGNGDLGYHLGITATDSYVQVDDPNYAATYAASKQPPTRPTPDVKKIGATEAVLLYSPKVVIGSWITHQSFSGPGHDKGVKEGYIIRHVETYIHIGNDRVQHQKPILQYPHDCYKFPWIVSRATHLSGNVIWVWGK